MSSPTSRSDSRNGRVPTTTNSVRAVKTITPHCARWLISGSEFCSDAGRIANLTVRKNISRLCGGADHRSPKKLLDGTTQMSMPPLPRRAVISSEPSRVPISTDMVNIDRDEKVRWGALCRKERTEANSTELFGLGSGCAVVT